MKRAVRASATFDSPRKCSRSLSGWDGFPTWAGFYSRDSLGKLQPTLPDPVRPPLGIPEKFDKYR